MYLSWNNKTITDFSDKNITSLYCEGYLFTREGKGQMYQTRSLRIDLNKFEPSSENKRVLRKNEAVELTISPLPYANYHWSIGKLGKDFYETKFGLKTFSANKIKELLTDENKSNFNKLFIYTVIARSESDEAIPRQQWDRHVARSRLLLAMTILPVIASRLRPTNCCTTAIHFMI